MRTLHTLTLVLAGLGTLAGPPAPAQEASPVALDTIQVKAKKAKALVEPDPASTSTQSTVTREGVAASATAGQSNLWKTLDLLPGLHVETADAFGFASRSPQNMRIRGQAGIGTAELIEGVPVWAIETPGSRADIFDMENIQSVSLIRGAVPPDTGFGGGDIAGVVNMSILKPAEDFGITANQGFGSNGFLRTFVRVDSGAFADGSKAFFSYSDSSADKWKGTGGAPDYRHHVALGLQRELSSWFSAEVYGDYNEEALHAFRSLNYAQAMDLKDYENYDYNSTLTGTPNLDTNYAGFNRERDRDLNLFGILTARLPNQSTLTFRPYYFAEYRPAYSGNSSIPGLSTPGVRIRTNDFTRRGGVLEYKTQLGATTLSVGDWYEVWDFPIDETYYTITPSGALQQASGEFAYRPTSLGRTQSPYVRAVTQLGRLKVDYGVRYYSLHNPGQNGFTSAGAVDPAASYHASTMDEWLPYLGLNYSLNPAVNLYASAGRNCARPQGYPEFMQTYIGARTAFSHAGVDMQGLVDPVKLVTSENYELGARIAGARWYVNPSVFYAPYQNKLMNVYDSVAQRNVKQSEGKAITYGAELEAGYQLRDDLSLFGSLSWIRSYLTQDLQTAANAYLAVKGNQTPDTPPRLAKVGLIYTYHGLEITPDAKFVDVRYGDSANTQRVPSYTVVDLNLDYRISTIPHLDSLDFGMNVVNLGDRRYIGLIGSFEDTQAASSSYLPGPRRAVAFHVGIKY